jgi:dephospho-CoA kinase
MTWVLSSGMAGTGKSSVVERLVDLGYTAIDADQPEWSHWVPAAVPSASHDASLALDWAWREDTMYALLNAPGPDPLFVSGCSPNQGTFRDRFDTVVLLSASPDVILHRVATRTTNAFGKTASERARILADQREVEPLLRASADVEIDTGMTLLNDVAGRLIELASARR